MNLQIFRFPLLCFAACLGLIACAFSQEKNAPLSLGDPAPKLTYSEWMKGSPLEDFSDNGVYVMEFWATWCIPCIAAMPHISDIADKHNGRVKVIAVNVMERVGDQPYSVAIPKVKSFVNENEKNMRFNIVLDDNNQNMKKGWLENAGIRSIPTTIIVKDNKIWWIGHPNFVDSTLNQILDGKYDLDSQKIKYEKAHNSSNEQRLIFQSNMDRISSLLDSKQYDEAVQVAKKIIAESPKSSYPYRQRLMQILVAFYPSQTAIDYLQETNDYSTNTAIALAAFLATEDGISNELIAMAINIMEQQEETNTYTLDRLAILQSRIGLFKHAADNQRKVLQLLIDAQKEKPEIIAKEAVEGARIKLQEYIALSEGTSN